MDASFDSYHGGGISTDFGGAYAVALQADGKVVFGSNVRGVRPTGNHGIDRLNTDGSLDADFAIRQSDDKAVFTIVVQPDGKLIMGGYPQNGNTGTLGQGIARLKSDGSVDESFVISSNVGSRVQSIVLQRDGKVVFVGSFTAINGVARPGIARLNNDAGGASSFFTGAVSVGDGFDYLAFRNDISFGYYYAGFSSYLYHNDMDFEYIVDAANGRRGVYLYDFKLSTFFYTEPALWPYLYNFSAAAFFYYFPDTNRPGHYTTNPRVFYNLGNGQFVFSP